MFPAVIALQFDPSVAVAGLTVRLETIALALVILATLVVAAIRAGRANRRSAESSLASLRRDDLLYLAIGALPGAVIGGRILYGLDFLDYYTRVAQPAALLDPTRGTLSLLGAVVGGTITAAYVAWLIGAPLRRWLDVAIVALLLAIGLGKLTMVLGGGGQGAPTTVPWALAFTGPGPWRSLGADLPAHPSQVYEALWALAGIPLVLFFTRDAVWRALPEELRHRPGAEITDRDRARRDYDVDVADLPPVEGAAPGLLFGVGLGWWALGRVLVGFTWRDDPVALGLNAEQLAALVVLAILALFLLRALLSRSGEAY